jgi:phenylpropionate dioxygenase-like ring-hydroxylating dioxygenase large terminal subunit
LDGRLAKAPSFTTNSPSEFDSSRLHLFPVHVHVDRNGFVYVNLDAKKQPDISWESQYGKMDERDVLVNSGIIWDNIEYDFTWTCDGQFNWKLMQENFNEVSCFKSVPMISISPRLTSNIVLSLLDVSSRHC